MYESLETVEWIQHRLIAGSVGSGEDKVIEKINKKRRVTTHYITLYFELGLMGLTKKFDQPKYTSKPNRFPVKINETQR